jgi:outer membrane autotransporter protein
MRPGSHLNVNGRAYFANHSSIDVGLNTLNISGDTWFKNGSSYTLQRTASATGKITIGGVTHIDDDVKLIITGSNVVNAGNSVILTSAGGFADQNVFVNALYELEKTTNDIRIGDFKGSGSIINQAGGRAGGGSSPNLGHIAVLVDSILSSSDNVIVQGKIIDTLFAIENLYDGGHGSEADKAVRQLIGEDALTAIHANIENVHQVRSALGRRMSSIRNVSAPPSSGSEDALSRVWAAGFGSWAKQKDAEGLFGYKYRTAGVILGFDYKVAAVPGLTLGINGSLSRGKMENNDHYSETDIDSYGIGIYGMYEAANGFFAEANMGFGWSENDLETVSVLTGSKRKADFDSKTFQVGLNLGYTFRLADNVSLIPTAGLQYIRVKQDGWREKLSDPNLSDIPAHWFGDSKQDFLEIPVSLKLESTHQVGSVTISPEVHVGVIFTANDPKSSMRMGFVGSDRSVSLTGVDSGKNRFQAGTSVKIQASDLVDIFVSYEMETRSKYTSHYGHLGIGFSF